MIVFCTFIITCNLVRFFYRAMHYSANGKARSCDRMSSLRPSVRPSVTLMDCDHIGWNSSKIISPLVSLGCSLFADPNIRGLLQGEHPEILAHQSDPPSVNLSVGDIRSQIATEWLQIAQRSQWRAYRNPPSIFRMVPSLTPYDVPFPKNGVTYTPRYANGHISATGDPIHFMFGSRVGFSGSTNRMALFPVKSNPSWRQAAILDNFELPYLRNGSFDPLI